MYRNVVQDVVDILTDSMKNNEKEKKMKKGIDKGKKRWYNVKAHHARGEGKDTAFGLEKNFKKVEKTFKKGIDKSKRKWYNNQVAAKAEARNDLWKLNNKREVQSYKKYV